MKRQKVEVINGRYFGLSNLNAVVKSAGTAIELHSRHATLEAARKEADKASRRSGLVTYAAVPMIGNPHHDYRPGEIVNPDDLQWPRAPQTCSECCRNCTPTHLDYRCPIQGRKVVCDTVRFNRRLPMIGDRLKKIAGIRAAAIRYPGIKIDDILASRILDAADETVKDEIEEDGGLDTATRDYFAMAVIEVILPGSPTVQDSLLGGDRQYRWHWPCNGSSGPYARAFHVAFRKACIELNVTQAG